MIPAFSAPNKANIDRQTRTLVLNRLILQSGVSLLCSLVKKSLKFHRSDAMCSGVSRC
jgi:hypothetical protein